MVSIDGNVKKYFNQAVEKKIVKSFMLKMVFNIIFNLNGNGNI